MIVYCDATECKNNKDGECNNRFRTGVQAISLREDLFGRLDCSDREEYEDDDRK